MNDTHDADCDDLPVTTVPWPTLEPDALAGAAGHIVSMVAPHTEADPAAVLLQLLAVFGATVENPWIRVANRQHRAVVHPLLIGRTSSGAKGTALGVVTAIRRRALPEFDVDKVVHGLSTGEGLIELVRDGTGLDDPGILDKRLLVEETEYRTVLARGRREGSTLAPILRQAWDLDDLRTLTRQRSALTCTRPHIVVVGHCTPKELTRMVTESDLAGGSVNRLLLCCSQRTRLNPRFGNMPEETLAEAAELFLQAHEHARPRNEVGVHEQFWSEWEAAYEDLVRDRPETWAAEATARGHVQVLRLALIYCLLDRADAIGVEHLRAALAMWRYCDWSARWIFSTVWEEVERTRAEDLAEYIRDGGPQGRTRTEINTDFYFGHRTAKQIEADLAPLVHAGTVSEMRVPTRGRPQLRYVHRLCGKSGYAQNADQAAKQPAEKPKTPRKKQDQQRKKVPLLPRQNPFLRNVMTLVRGQKQRLSRHFSQIRLFRTTTTRHPVLSNQARLG